MNTEGARLDRRTEEGASPSAANSEGLAREVHGDNHEAMTQGEQGRLSTRNLSR